MGMGMGMHMHVSGLEGQMGPWASWGYVKTEVGDKSKEIGDRKCCAGAGAVV